MGAIVRGSDSCCIRIRVTLQSRSPTFVGAPNLYISRIVVRNFRNIKFLDVPLRDGVTSIVGENNTGKTNLIHAIRLVLDSDLPGYQRQLTAADVTESAATTHPLQVLVSLEFKGFE